MQIADVLVSLNGDVLNQVPRSGVTPAELLVLQALHGGDAVTDIKITGDTEDRTSRAERGRLFDLYSRATPRGRISPEIDALFPGAAARLPATFDELDIDETLMARQQHKPDPLDHDGDGRKGGSRKGARGKKTKPEADEADAGEDADETEDSSLFN
jgi:hypothetical protein